MLVEAGKRYKRRDGKISGIIKKQNPFNQILCYYDSSNCHTYRECGYFNPCDITSPYDLIEEYIEVQIKENCYYKSKFDVIYGPMRKVLPDLFMCEKTGAQFKGNGAYHNIVNILDADRFDLVSEHKVPIQDYPSGTLLKNQKDEVFVKGDMSVYQIIFNNDGIFSLYIPKYKLEELNKNNFTVLMILPMSE